MSGNGSQSREAPGRWAELNISPAAASAPGTLWAVFLYRLPVAKGAPYRDPGFIEKLRALPCEGALFLRMLSGGGIVLCWKADAMRPRDLEGLVERVATVPAFARSCPFLRTLYDRGQRLATDRFGARFDPQANRFLAFGAEWRVGAVFLSLPWPLPQRPWQLFSRKLLCLDWCAPNTAIVAKWERSRSGARIAWDRQLIKPLEEAGGAAQEYPLLATVRPLGVIRVLLATAHNFDHSLTTSAQPPASPLHHSFE
jgi:hypothetical protein